MRPRKIRIPDKTGRRSFALVATLGLLVVATILLALFVSTTLLDRSASYSYSQSLKADQIGLGALHLVVGQLQAEMYKDAIPDTGTYGTNISVFTNVASFNILPQANVTNTALPALIKMSTNTLFFSGTNSVASYATGTLQASTTSSTTPSLNGRSVSTNNWNQIYLGQYPTAASAPYWVLMTRSGPTNGATISFGASGNTLNNPTPSNGNYAVGRIAYAIYDEGSLLDITAAGYDPGVLTSASQVLPIKGTLAGADLSQIPGITSPTTFIKWRNAASSANANAYLSYVTNFASTNGFQQVYPGDSTFISRQDLIEAAQNGSEGFNSTALPYLATFTRELNAPSWAPSVSVPTGTAAKYQYAANATTLTKTAYFPTNPNGRNPNPFIPFVRYTNGGTVTGYRADGTSYFYTVNAGDPVVKHRFPLDRLNWIGPNGPNSAAFGPSVTATQQANAIQACFGLIWGPVENLSGDANWAGLSVWKYVGSTGIGTATTEQIATKPAYCAVETLSDVANEAAPREPNFFELLQAGVLSGSLSLSAGSSQTLSSSGENYPTLQLLRMGASIISQVQNQAYPINIEYNQNDLGNLSEVASGIANLPYLNTLKFVSGQSVNDPPGNPSTSPMHEMGVYGLVGLWNPHQQNSAAVTRPSVRLCIQGSISIGSGWSNGASGYTSVNGTSTGPATYAVINDGTGSVYGANHTLPIKTYTIQLINTPGSTTGVNGFLNPYPITSADIDQTKTGGGTGSNIAAGWTSATSSLVSSADPEKSITYEAFQLPDIGIKLNQVGANIPGVVLNPTPSNPSNPGNIGLGSSHIVADLGGPPNALGSPFQLILEYSDGSGHWIPYDYFTGVSSPASWVASKGMAMPHLQETYAGSGATTSVVSPYALPVLDDVLHSRNNYHSAEMFNPDPRTIRFGAFALSGDTNPGGGTIENGMIDSLWSGNSTPYATVPFNICGYGGFSAYAGLPIGVNSLPASFSGFFLPADFCRNNLPITVGSVAGGVGTFFLAYKDPDGVQRIADSGLFTTTLPFTAAPTTGNPFYDPNDTPTSPPRTADRPVILNRSFAGIGELGYAFRDDPWRSIDFSSVYNAVSTSADSGLLDLFTITDNASPLVGGRISLNTRNTAVLTAILNGTVANVGDTVNNTAVSSLSNPSGMATALVNYTTTTAPLANKDQLVTQFGPTLGSGNTVNPAFGNSDEQNVKEYREGFVRALADVGQTRTWNLLIDLVAQAGKYPSTATTQSQFEVEGERHYWLHVSIDRFTGKVIDRQLELIGP